MPSRVTLLPSPARHAGTPSPEIMALRDAVFADMGHGREIRRLFDEMEHVLFFVKDATGAFMAVNRTVLQRLGLECEEQIIGLTDHDIHPPHVAKKIREDDWKVMSTRQPLVDQIEAIFSTPHRLEWHSTTKLPLMDEYAEVIGVMGLTHPCAPPEPEEDSIPKPLHQVVDQVRQEHAGSLRVAELAASAGISPRRLNELFHTAYQMSAQQFILSTRVQAAMDDLLHAQKTYAQIAHDHGFVDQSAFNRHFRNLTGMTPRTFQKRQRLLPEPWQKVPLISPTL